MNLTLVYFAWLRTRIGHAEERVIVPATVLTIADLLDWLAARGAGYQAALADRTVIRVAVNHDYAALDRRLNPGDEVALFPPVTGG